LFIKKAQEELLLTLAVAQDRSALEKRIPEVLERLREYTTCLKQGQVDTRDLVITRLVGKTWEEYRVNTPTTLVLQQLETVGLTLYPGQRVGYLLAEESATYSSDQNLIPAPFLTGEEKYDPKKYINLLIRAAHELLVIFGYNINKLCV
jgi:DNA polymerase elongation subunit (family B)